MTAVGEAPSGSRGRSGLSPAEREMWVRMYERHGYSKLPWFSPRPSPFLVSAVRRGWLPRREPLLDIGCGAGTNVLWLAKRGFRTSGVDIAPAAVAAAQTRARAARVRPDVRVADASDLPFPKGAFGTVLDFGCFHTLPFDLRPRYAAEVARVLRPDGPFLLSWIGREETRQYGPPHRPSLAEVTAAFEPFFVFSSVEFSASGSPGGWATPGGSLALYRARLLRRRGRQPPPR